MNSIAKVIRWIWRKWFLMGPSPSSHGPTSVHPPQSPSQLNASVQGKPPKSGYVRREYFQIHSIKPGEIVLQSEEAHYQRNGINEGSVLHNKVETASGEITDFSNIKSTCSNCGRVESEIIRCEESGLLVCHACKRIFKKADGTRVTVSPNAYKKREDEYDTWAAYKPAKSQEEDQ